MAPLVPDDVEPLRPESNGPQLAATGPVLDSEPTPQLPHNTDIAVDPMNPAAASEPRTGRAVPEPAIAENAIPLPAIAGTGEQVPLVARNVPPRSLLSPLPQPEGDRPSVPAYPDTGLPAIESLLPGTLPKTGDLAKPTVPKASPPKPEILAPAWPEPATLLARLNALGAHESTRAWATETAALVRKLGPAIAGGSGESSAIVARLRELDKEVAPLAAMISDRALAKDLSRAGHSLDRRLDVWQQVGKIGGLAAAAAPAPSVDPKSISVCLAQIDSLMTDSPQGKAWRNYLAIDALHDWSSHHDPADERLPRGLAEELLTRLSRTPLTAQQREFLSAAPFSTLRAELLRHTSEAVDAVRLLRDMERYEQTDLPSDARRLAADCQSLALESDAAYLQLDREVEMHYRNANVRLAVSAELLNRLMPKREPEYAPVRDTVLGAQVRGRSMTSNNLAIRLIPDPERIRLALEVTGQVAALTSSTSGPATFISDSQSMYTARKPIEVDLQGVRTWPAEVDVWHNDSRLRRIHTDFDGILLLGPLVRGVARQQHDQRMPEADAEIREKIADKAKQRIDTETQGQLTKAARRLHDKVIEPMDVLALEPTLIAAETTDQRFIMRVRLAGRDQLGAHTPRPQAPADSLASVQVHESALNNVLQRLELDGKTFQREELARHLATRLSRPMPQAADTDEEEVQVTFAARDALRARCSDGRLELTLAIARLTAGNRRWKDFQVRVYYRPEVKGRSVELFRDGVVQLMGKPMSTASQLALRGVFSKVFAAKAPLTITPESFVNNPQISGMAVTQFSIDDGWIGAALGPHRAVAVHPTSGRPGLFRR